MPVLIIHMLIAILVGFVYIVISLFLVYALDLKIIYGLDSAFTVLAVFVASLISTSIYYPVAVDNKVKHIPVFFRTHFGLMILTIAVAFFSSLGGGMLRRAITGEDILLAPDNSAWAALVFGWFAAFYFSYFELNICRKESFFQKFNLALDSWALGVFGVGGMLGALEWLAHGERQANFLVQLFVSAAFAALTGAGGGLVAEIFARITIKYRHIRDVFSYSNDWLLARYTQIGFWTGVSSFIFIKSIPHVIPLRKASKEEFEGINIAIRPLVNNMIKDLSDINLHDILILFEYERGINILIYIIFGFLTCYMYRSARFCEINVEKAS